jgi:iron complex outermembrane receptor protein
MPMLVNKTLVNKKNHPSVFFSLKPSVLAVKALLLSASLVVVPSFAFEAPVAVDSVIDNSDDIEVITITNQRHNAMAHQQTLAQGKTSAVDLANWLSSIPGANINSNGPITGIAQYRGLYGDRVSASLDGHPVVGAGPNSMDTPLSYSTPLIVDAMTVYRGIAPVSAGMNTLGGAIDVKMRKAETMGNENVEVSGDLQAGYRSNNSAKTLSAVSNIAKGDVAVMVYGNSQVGDSMESGDGVVISPTDFDKVQFGGDVRYNNDESVLGLSYHYTETNDSGTPALPMDIEYIKSHRVSLDGNFTLGDWQADWLIGYMDADHGMTNFLMRENTNVALPLSKYRRNNATATTTDFTFAINQAFDFGELTFGLDGYLAAHDSIITNPNNAMFEVVNFNNVEDNRYGFYGEWKNKFDQTNVQFGVRVKRAEANAGEVNTSMAMMMNNMGTLSKDLKNDFNNADRKVSDNNVDLALSTQTQLTEPLSLYVGLGLKNRAPSYQERYLWTPMESTGGLADGHTYIGDINLKSETAYQADLGLTYQTKSLMIAPHIFYQNIDNYIQGTPLGMADMSAKMAAKMMSNDDSPLKFSNVDAKLYGADVNWFYHLTDQWQLSGIASYVKGERRDIDDNLYRIAPLNGQVSITYADESIITNVTLIAVAAQNDVSLTNTEQKTSGYGTVNIDVEYFVNNDFTLRVGVDNLLDREYQNHLGGYNRVKGTDIPVMTRLPSEGVSAWVDMTYSF